MNKSLFLKEYDLIEEYVNTQNKKIIECSKFKIPYNSRRKEKYYFPLLNSYEENIPVTDFHQMSFSNICFVNFMGLEPTVEQHYLPLYFACKTNVKKVFMYYNKKNVKVAYKVTKNQELIKINPNNITKYKIDVVIGRGGGINTYVQDFPRSAQHALKINIAPIGHVRKDCLSNIYFNNHYLIKSTSPFISHYLSQNNGKKKFNIIIYPGLICNYKNQVKFCKLIDPKVVKNHLLLFCGNGDHDYIQKMYRILKSKKIKFVHLERVNQYFLRKLYAISKCLVLYSIKDFNPRVIFEGIWANLPFLTTDKIVLSPQLLECGFQIKVNNRDKLNNTLHKLLTTNWENKVYNFAEKNFQIDKISEEIINMVHQKYLASKNK